MWTTNGTQADWMCLLANTSDGPPHRNKSLICLPMDLPGKKIIGVVFTRTLAIDQCHRLKLLLLLLLVDEYFTAPDKCCDANKCINTDAKPNNLLMDVCNKATYV
jgi:hypothetical protein